VIDDVIAQHAVICFCANAASFDTIFVKMSKELALSILSSADLHRKSAQWRLRASYIVISSYQW